MQIPEKRMIDYESYGFGLFMHWGLYSLLGKGEWIQYFSKTPRDEYAKLMEDFTAENWNPRKIAKLAKEAGMRYIVLTTRHHEGFSLYDTRGLTDFDAPHSAAKRDLVAEFVEACNAEGLAPFFYHTTLDWHNPDYVDNFPAYVEYLRKSVEILCTCYGKIAGFWFDGNWDQHDAPWEEDKLYAMIRKHQPDAIILNNPGWQTPGVLTHPEVDVACFEQGKPKRIDHSGDGKYIVAEMSQTLNGYWSRGRSDFMYKAIPELIDTLCICRREGANYLLNVGPESGGDLPEMACETLKKLGEWISLWPDAFYNGRPTDIKGGGDDFVLKSADGKLYAFIYGLNGANDQLSIDTTGKGSGARSFIGVNERVKEIRWLDNGESLKFFQDCDKSMLCFYATSFERGMNTLIRVAQISVESVE